MEYQKFTNLLDTASDNVPRFINKRSIEVHDQSGNAEDKYKPRKQIIFKTSMLRSDISDYSNAYIAVTWEIKVVKRVFTLNDFVAPNNTQVIATATYTVNTNNVIDGKLYFKNNASFISCVSKINNVLIDNAGDLDFVITMYNLTEYSKNYSKTTGKLWNCYRGDPNSGVNSGINCSIRDYKFFDYKTKFIESVMNANTLKQNVKIVVPLKHLSNFWETLDV